MKFANWVYDYSGQSSRERKAAYLHFLERYKNEHPKAYKYIYDAIEIGDLKVIGFCPELYFVSSEMGLSHSLFRSRFDSPALLLKPIHAPVLHTLFLKQTIESADIDDLFNESKRTDVNQCLKWVMTLIKASTSDKLKITRKLLENFKIEATNDDSSHDPRVIKDFYNEFKKPGSIYQNIGFAVNASYLRIKGPDIGALFVHPFAMPVLLYQMRSFPMYTLASPAIRLDGSVLLEGNKDIRTDLVGITG